MPITAAFTANRDVKSDLDFTIDWSDWLESSEHIQSAVWTAPVDLTVHDETIDATQKKATAFVKGGTVGQSYLLTCQVFTTALPSRTDERSILLVTIQR
jgi:hypothetical protein